MTRINAYRALMDRPAVTLVANHRFNNDDEQRAAMLMPSSGVAGINGLVTGHSDSMTIFDPRPPGTFSKFGSGCGAGSGSRLTAGAAPGNRPAIGRGFLSLLGGVDEHRNLPVVYLGLSGQAADLSLIGPTGCSLYTDIQLSVQAILFSHPQPFDLPLSNTPALVGARVYLQGVAVDTRVNRADIVTTNGGEMVFGY